MSEYTHVEKPFLDQLKALDWMVIDHGQGAIPTDPAKSLRTNFREWILPDVFRASVRAINRTAKGDVSFHWKCMMAPQTIIDYIVVHELCHFYHLNHTEAFWNEVDKVMPNYRERKEWLRKHGAGLDV